MPTFMDRKFIPLEYGIYRGTFPYFITDTKLMGQEKTMVLPNTDRILCAHIGVKNDSKLNSVLSTIDVDVFNQAILQPVPTKAVAFSRIIFGDLSDVIRLLVDPKEYLWLIILARKRDAGDNYKIIGLKKFRIYVNQILQLLYFFNECIESGDEEILSHLKELANAKMLADDLYHNSLRKFADILQFLFDELNGDEEDEEI
jgi:hypothetical protein